MESIEKLKLENQKLSKRLEELKLREEKLEQTWVLITSTKVYKFLQILNQAKSRSKNLINALRNLQFGLQDDIATQSKFTPYKRSGNVLDEDEIVSFVKKLENKKTKFSRKISIIVLNHNSYEYTSKCISALIKNTNYKNYEIIYVDNGSHDIKTKSFLEKIRGGRKIKIKILEFKENLSFAMANNLAAKKASGEYLIFLNNDTIPLNGWLSALFEQIEKRPDSILGSKLIYPKRNDNEFPDSTSFDCTIQHQGIKFSKIDNFLYPENFDRGDHPFSVESCFKKEIAAVTGACMFVKKALFFKLGGFYEDYHYGYEDVDFCLKAKKSGFKTEYGPTSILFHHEYASQKMVLEKNQIRDNRAKNKKLLTLRWASYLRKEYLLDKIEKKFVFSSTPLKFGLLVTENNESSFYGDYFTAMNLSKYLKQIGYDFILIDKKTYNTDPDIIEKEDIDIIINLLSNLDIFNANSKINNQIYKVAWIRNRLTDWFSQSDFTKYDLILTGSTIASNEIAKTTGVKTQVLRLGADIENFKKSERNEEFSFDVVFVGNYFGVERKALTYLSQLPEKFKKNIKIGVFGKNIGNYPGLKKIWCGEIGYEKLPILYSNSKIVIEDHLEHLTKKWDFINSRIFEAGACGAAVLSDELMEFKRVFPKNSYLTYSNYSEFKSKLKYLLQNQSERQIIGSRLMRNIKESHSYLVRANQLINYIKQELNDRQS